MSYKAFFQNIFFTFFIFTFFSCQNSDKKGGDVSGVDAAFDLVRFERAFYTASPEKLPTIKQRFPYLFPKQYSDSIWIARMTDSLQQVLFTEVEKQFGDFSLQHQQLEMLFKHYKFYFPKTKLPKVITLTSDVDYQNKVIYADSLLLIATDTFLGKDNLLYSEIAEYQRNLMQKELLPVAVAEALVYPKIYKPKQATLLSKMVFYGKLHYIVSLLLPNFSDAQIMGYSQKQMAWVEGSQQHIWSYFVTNQLLFDTNPKLSQRFIDQAPFSKFYLEFDQESPGRIGQWVGWQIVNSFMKNNDLSLSELLSVNTENLFKKSKYKPKK